MSATCRRCGGQKKGRVGFLCDGCLGGPSLRRSGTAPDEDGSPLEAMAPDWCDECGARHSPERRRKLIARMLPAKAHEIAEEWTCFYPDGAKSVRMLFRDLNAIGAVSIGSEWTLPTPCLDCGHRHGGRAYGLCLVKDCGCIAVRRAA